MNPSSLLVPRRAAARSPALSFINLSLLLAATMALVVASGLGRGTIPNVASLWGGCGPPPDEPAVLLQVLGSGQCAWNREIVAAASVPELLRQYQRSAARPGILIAGSETARFGDMVAVLDAVRLADVPYSLETRVRPILR